MVVREGSTGWRRWVAARRASIEAVLTSWRLLLLRASKTGKLESELYNTFGGKTRRHEPPTTILIGGVITRLSLRRRRRDNQLRVGI